MNALREAALMVMMRVRTVTTDAALDAEIASHSECPPDCLQKRLAELVRDMRVALRSALDEANA